MTDHTRNGPRDSTPDDSLLNTLIGKSDLQLSQIDKIMTEMRDSSAKERADNSLQLSQIHITLTEMKTASEEQRDLLVDINKSLSILREDSEWIIKEAIRKKIAIKM